MTFNTSDELRRLYQSPILSRPNFTNQHLDFNSNKYSRDNFKDYSRFDFSRDLPRNSTKFDNLRDNYKNYNRYDLLRDGSFNYNTNKDYFDNTYNKYSTSYDNLKDYNSNKYSRDNLRDYNRDYLYSNLNPPPTSIGNNNNYLNKDYTNNYQYGHESSFVMPNYLKSFERFTPNRYSNFQTPNKLDGFSSPNRYNPLNNKFTTSINRDLNRDYLYSNLNPPPTSFGNNNNYLNKDYTNNYLNKDDWDNYHNISNSPNLKFKTQFYPHNNYTPYNSRDNLRDLNRDYLYSNLNRDDFNYIYHHPYPDTYRDNLFRNNYYDMKDLKDNMKFVYNREKLEKIKDNLNTATSNQLNSSFNFQPLEDTKLTYLNREHRDRRELDRRSPIPSRYRSRSTGNSEELDIDEVYRKLKEQKKQLQSLKANLN